MKKLLMAFALLAVISAPAMAEEKVAVEADVAVEKAAEHYQWRRRRLEEYGLTRNERGIASLPKIKARYGTGTMESGAGTAVETGRVSASAAAVALVC